MEKGRPAPKAAPQRRAARASGKPQAPRPEKNLQLILLGLLVVATLGVCTVVAVRIVQAKSIVPLNRLLPQIDSLLSDPAQMKKVAALLDKATLQLAKEGGGIDSELSILKRRRALAAFDRQKYQVAYLDAALKAKDRLPHAQELLAVCVAAALDCDRSVAAATATLKTCAPRLSEPRFAALAILAATRTGALAEPTSLLAAQHWVALADTVQARQPALASQLAINGALSALLTDDSQGARVICRDRFTHPDTLPPATLQFLGELAYDFGDSLEAAALFSRLEGSRALLRQADAFIQAKENAQARSVWQQALMQTSTAPDKKKVSELALYNLASTTPPGAEASRYLERLRAEAPDFVPGILLYARTLAENDAIKCIDSARAEVSDPRLELELVKLAVARDGFAKTRSQLWILANKYQKAPSDTRAAARWITAWGAWYFAFNGNFGEAYQFATADSSFAAAEDSLVSYYTALSSATEGRLDEAEKAFTAAALSGATWRLAANLAAVCQAKHDHKAAVAYYQNALALRPPRSDEAEIRLRLALLFRALGRQTEARHELDAALILDPENRRVRAEARK